MVVVVEVEAVHYFVANLEVEVAHYFVASLDLEVVADRCFSSNLEVEVEEDHDLVPVHNLYLDTLSLVADLSLDPFLELHNLCLVVDLVLLVD